LLGTAEVAVDEKKRDWAVAMAEGGDICFQFSYEFLEERKKEFER
jgi:hypothetical protein